MDTKKIELLAEHGVGIPDAVRDALRMLPEEAVSLLTELDAYSKRFVWTLCVEVPRRALDRTKFRAFSDGVPRTWIERSIWTDVATALRTWAEAVSLVAATDRGRIDWGVYDGFAEDKSALFRVIGTAAPTDAERAEMDAEARWRADQDGP